MRAAPLCWLLLARWEHLARALARPQPVLLQGFRAPVARKRLALSRSLPHFSSPPSPLLLTRSFPSTERNNVTAELEKFYGWMLWLRRSDVRSTAAHNEHMVGIAMPEVVRIIMRRALPGAAGAFSSRAAAQQARGRGVKPRSALLPRLLHLLLLLLLARSQIPRASCPL